MKEERFEKVVKEKEDILYWKVFMLFIPLLAFLFFIIFWASTNFSFNFIKICFEHKIIIFGSGLFLGNFLAYLVRHQENKIVYWRKIK